MPPLQEKKFIKALQKARPRISVRRAQLYGRQLDYASLRLNDIATNAHGLNYNAANVPAPGGGALGRGVTDWKAELTTFRTTRGLNLTYNVFARALTGDNRLKLLVNLAKQLDPWAAYFIYYSRQAQIDAVLDQVRQAADTALGALPGPHDINARMDRVINRVRDQADAAQPADGIAGAINPNINAVRTAIRTEVIERIRTVARTAYEAEQTAATQDERKAKFVNKVRTALNQEKNAVKTAAINKVLEGMKTHVPALPGKAAIDNQRNAAETVAGQANGLNAAIDTAMEAARTAARNELNAHPIAKAKNYKELVDAIIASNPFNKDPLPPDPPIAGTPGMPTAVSLSIYWTTYHFLHNLHTACQRIFANWNDLNEAFSPYIPWMGTDTIHSPLLPIFEQVERFIPSGSDYHKGGQQVMLVDFAIVPGRLGPTKRTSRKHHYGRHCAARHNLVNANVLSRGRYAVERIVYKPGDVELDCRMVGDSAVIQLIQPTGYTQANNSMSEWINGQLGTPPARSLPSYVLLPYNSGSRLAANWALAPGNQVMDIRQSYGFIQFLTHQPELEDIKSPSLNPSLNQFQTALGNYRKPNWIDETDYITNVAGHKHDYFFIWGQLMAMCVTFSMSDFHSQNTIVHRSPYPRNAAAYPPPNWVPKPHLIDLEDGFKWPMDRIAQTAILDANINKARLGEQRLAVMNDKRIDIQGSFQPSPIEYEKNQCFDFIGGNIYRQKPNPDTRRAMCEGFLAVMETFRNQNALLQPWVNQLSNTVARFVPIPTSKFYQQMHGYAEETLNLQAVRAKRVRSTRTAWNGEDGAANTPERRQWRLMHPFFGLEYADHNFHDFEHRDIPYYVHELGHNHLLNSRGWKVDVNVGYAWQEGAAINNLPVLNADTGRPNPAAPPPNLAPAALHDYFPDTAINVVQAQLTRLAPPNDGNALNFFELTTRMLDEILRIQGHSPLFGLTGDQAEDPGGQPPPPNITLDGQVNGQAYRVPGATGYTYEWNSAGGAGGAALAAGGVLPAGWHWIVRDNTNAIVYHR